MTDPLRAEAAESAVQTNASLQSSHMRLVRHVTLSAATFYDDVSGHRETTYRLHQMDMATRRLVPHLLGISADGCDHIGCTMVMLNSEAAGWLAAEGLLNEHSSDLAVSLLNEAQARRGDAPPLDWA